MKLRKVLITLGLGVCIMMTGCSSTPTSSAGGNNST